MVRTYREKHRGRCSNENISDNIREVSARWLEHIEKHRGTCSNENISDNIREVSPRWLEHIERNTEEHVAMRT